MAPEEPVNREDQEEPEAGLERLRGGRRDQLLELRRELLEERKRIVEEIRRMESEVAELERPLHREAVTDDEESARADRSIQLDDAVEKLCAGRLRTLDRALEAMSRGRYGTCEGCAQPIDLDRLRALPDTPLCVTCARRAERQA